MYIPPGADNNYMVTFVQLSDAAPHAVAGDFRFVVNALESPSFVRTGADLEFKLNLSLKEALLGWSRCARAVDHLKWAVVASHASLRSWARREIIHPNGSRIVVNMTDITVPGAVGAGVIASPHCQACACDNLRWLQQRNRFECELAACRSFVSSPRRSLSRTCRSCLATSSSL